MTLEDSKDGASENKESKDVKLEDVSTFEDLLKALGTQGRWSTSLFIICAMCAFVSPMQTLSYQFLGATPYYWCHIDTLVEANWRSEDIIELAMPNHDVANGKDHGRCHMYDFDFAIIANLSREEAISYADEIKMSKVIGCTRRDFNRSQYQSTVTTEWDLVCDRRVLYSTTQAAAQAGKFVGYFFTGYLLDTLGRRPVALMCSVLAITSGFLSAASPNVEFYILLKIVVTCAMAGVYLGVFVLAMETCSSEQRSKVGTLFVVPWAIGYMVLPGIAYFIRTWKLLQTALTLPALFLIAYFWILPESPRWLILKGHNQKAMKIFKKAAKFNGFDLPPDGEVLAAIERVGTVEVINAETSGERDSFLIRAKKVIYDYFSLLRIAELRVRTLVVFFCWFAASMVYYGVALNSTNLSADTYMYVFLGGLLEVPSYVLLWPAVVYLGRKKSLSLLFGVCGITILLVMIVLRFAPNTPVGVLMFMSLTGKMAITAAFHLAWMFTAELFPTKYRSLAVGQASVNARVGSICSPYINDILGDLIVWAPSLLFGIVSVMAAFLSMLLPETRGKELSEDISEDINSALESRTGEANVAYIPEQGEKIDSQINVSSST